MLDFASLPVVLRDWQRLSGPVRRILLVEECLPAAFHQATVTLPDGRRKLLATGSNGRTHAQLLQLCEALLAGTASFDGQECLAQPQWTPRQLSDGRAVAVYPKVEGMHQVAVDAATHFSGRSIAPQSVFIADTKLARALAQSIAEGDLTIESVRQPKATPALG